MIVDKHSETHKWCLIIHWPIFFYYGALTLGLLAETIYWILNGGEHFFITGILEDARNTLTFQFDSWNLIFNYFTLSLISGVFLVSLRLISGKWLWFPWNTKNHRFPGEDEKEAELHFKNWIALTEPLSGEVQDKFQAHMALLEAYELGHPDATFVLGTLIYSGELTEYGDKNEGLRLMRLGKAWGADQVVDSMLQGLGIDLDADSPVLNDDISISGERLAIACRKRIDELLREEQITKKQSEELYEVVRTSDEYHLTNVLGVLHNKKETRRLAEHAGSITGWDGENAIFYLSK